MIGAIIGDIIGSPHEFKGTHRYNFPLIRGFERGQNRFTDDSVLTIAMADTILTGTPYVENLKSYYRKYSDKGYGMKFAEWAESDYTMPYNSYSNGAIMRTSPVGWAFNTEKSVLDKAKEFASVTHNHPDSIKAAQCISYCIYMLRTTGTSKKNLLVDIQQRFGYDLNLDIEQMLKMPTFGTKCSDIMPKALYAFFNTDDYESATRLAICIDNDTDTIACIVGSLCEAHYGKVSIVNAEEIIKQLFDEYLLSTITQFTKKYMQELNYIF